MRNWHRRSVHRAAAMVWKAARLVLHAVLPVATLWLAGMQGAWAACVRYPGAYEHVVYMNMGQVYVPDGLAVGGLIKSQNFPLNIRGQAERMFNCRGGGYIYGPILQGSPVAGYYNVYSTNVQGVGIRLSRVDGPSISYYPHAYPTPNGIGQLVAGTWFQVELIKTANITGNGSLAGGTYTRYYGDGEPYWSALTTILSGDVNGITIITPSCSVDAGSRNIPVEFGRVSLSNFKGMDSTTGDRRFSIKLQCQANPNLQKWVDLRMDATQDPSNRQGVLRITQRGAGTATGVGIQLLGGDAQPVRFGEGMQVGPMKNGSYDVPYTARYYQTAARMRPGRADGTATFTLQYR
ncbi:fimbrial protein [Variovorax paradoxus]|uniref:fimbrial protein n=1 Tax=Variovorax paradoxus TaxID=34073 RepID=UPI0024789E1E